MRIVVFITDAIGASDIQRTLHSTVSHVEKITRDQISVADTAELFSCVACFRHDNRRLCTRCNNWLTAEMNSAERRTECLICDEELDEESLYRCLKCHAAKCRDCDVDHIFLHQVRFHEDRMSSNFPVRRINEVLRALPRFI